MIHRAWTVLLTLETNYFAKHVVLRALFSIPIPIPTPTPICNDLRVGVGIGIGVDFLIAE
jgi:hypothetical protein